MALIQTKDKALKEAKKDALRKTGITEIIKEIMPIGFSIKTSAGGYLKIFVIKDQTAAMLYPSKYEKEILIIKSKLLEFPTNKGIEYGFENITENESQLISMVLTKKNIPFFSTVSYENIISWIYQISPDERKVRSFPIVVSK